MAFGKLYSIEGNPRTTAIKAVAVANNIDLEFVNTDVINGVDADFLKVNPLGKIPTFVGADGFVLSECIAIAIYSTYTSTSLCLHAPMLYDENIMSTVIPV